MRDRQILLLSGWIATSLLFSGCASEPVWQKPRGTTETDFHRAAYECQGDVDRWANDMERSGRLETGNAFTNLSISSMFVQQKQQRYELCMQARGYKKTN